MKYVIIGTGIAGTCAAEAIRRLDRQGEIVMIGDEKGPPYCRPMISLVLDGSITPNMLPIRPEGFFRDLNITEVPGSRVKAMNADDRTVETADGRIIHYDRLLIASGADPRPVKTPGGDLENIFYMRTREHARKIREVIPSAKRALVLGGGLVGFKAAYGLLKQGLKTTMLIRSEHPLSMQVDETAGRIIRETLENRGLDVRVGVEVEAFEGNGSVRRARTSDGSGIDCELAVIGKGVLPSLDFVDRETLKVDLGVLVDKRMQTSDPAVYAAGDAAETVDVAREKRWVNAIWPEAAEQGRLAGVNMAGGAAEGEGSLGRNVIRIFDLDVLSGGLVNPGEKDGCDVLRSEDARRKVYRKMVFRGDRLVGLVMVNEIEQGGVLLATIHSRKPLSVPRESLLEKGFNYKTLLRPL